MNLPFNSEREAVLLLEAVGVTLDSNKWMNLDTAIRPLYSREYDAALYLCDRHDWVMVEAQ